MKKPFLSVLVLGILTFPCYAGVLSTDPEDVPAATALVADVDGDVRLLKQDSEEWQNVKKDQVVEAGDQIVTGKASHVDIALDAYLLNITRIQENTKAEFRSIQPTDIYLEDGSIFSALDGLDANDVYQIATPTAVAGVRGTHFDVAYDPSSEKFTAASLPTGDPEHVSRIFVSDPKNPNIAPVEIAENKQMDLKRGEPLQARFVRAADSHRVQAGKMALQHMGQRMPQFQERREQGKVQFQERIQERRQQMEKQGVIPAKHNPEMQKKIQEGQLQPIRQEGVKREGFEAAHDRFQQQQTPQLQQQPDRPQPGMPQHGPQQHQGPQQRHHQGERKNFEGGGAPQRKK